MPATDEWETKVQRLLKAELKRAGVTYAQLSEKLGKMGIELSEATIKNRLSRGKFSAAFMVQCLTAIGSQELRL